MGLIEPLVALILLACALAVAALVWNRRSRGRKQVTRRMTSPEHLDTVADWVPEAVRVLSVSERKAIELVRQALPGFIVLAQVPLSRFIRVPARHSHREWLSRVGGLSADLVICDNGSRVLCVVDVRGQQETERGKKRHDRLSKVLRAAGIGVQTWYDDQLPGPTEARRVLTQELALAASRRGKPTSTQPTSSKPMPLIPVAEIEEVLAEGDMADWDQQMEPVPSTFFDDLDLRPHAHTGRVATAH